MRDIRSIGRYHHHASFRLPFRRDSASPPSFRSSTLSVASSDLSHSTNSSSSKIINVVATSPSTNPSDASLGLPFCWGTDFSSLSMERPNMLESRRRTVAIRPSRATSPANSSQLVLPSGMAQNTSLFHPFPSDALNESRFSQRYGTNEDSASTTRGLRVAAREANAGASVADQMDRNLEPLHG